VGDRSGLPWLTASRLPELLLYQPTGLDESTGEPLPTHIRTPGGSTIELQGEELEAEIAGRCGSDVELTKLKHGIFDEAAISVIGLATIAGIGRQAGLDLDRRRFRANIVLETEGTAPFLEDEWVGSMLVFGESDPPPAVNVLMCDERCMMINLDPDTGRQDASVLKTVVRLNRTNAGVYASVARTGTVRVGDQVNLVLAAPAAR
jgi:uncharacterized protein YcbX